MEAIEINKIVTQHKYLLDRLLTLRTNITQQAELKLCPFARYYPDGMYTPSAINLAHYLLLRQYDLREMQQELTSLGLSSLGRGEANIIENIDKVINLLKQISKMEKPDIEYSEFLKELSDHNESLAYHTDKLLGDASSDREVRIMVTLPTEAATNYELIHSLINAGMNCARINCGHDNKHVWLKMIHLIHQAENATGRRCRIMMDIAGQKIRTGPIEAATALYHIKVKRNEYGTIISPGNILILSQDQFESETTKTFSSLFKIALEDKPYESLKAGDYLEFIDIRGKKRNLEIIYNKEENIYIGQCWQSAYITPETVFQHSRRTGLKKVHHQQKVHIKSFQVFPAKIKVFVNDQILVTRSNTLGRPALLDEQGKVVQAASVPISHDEIFNLVKTGHSVWIDDGKIGTVIKSISSKGLLLKVIHAPPRGAVVRSEKGLNFPDTELDTPPFNRQRP